MKEHWTSLTKTIQRTLVPHDVAHYREIERQNYSDLAEDAKRGRAVLADNDGNDGTLVNVLLSGLMRHPLCRNIAAPQIYLHRDPASQLTTFGNVIIVPSREMTGLRDDSHRMETVKAAIAHELGHIVSRDADPTVQSRRANNYRNQRMERRADLIAAYLCGDGGRALADWLSTKAKQEKPFEDFVAQRSSWLDRVTNRMAKALDRRYPPVEVRIRYLRDWADRHSRGESLPDLELELSSTVTRGALTTKASSPFR